MNSIEALIESLKQFDDRQIRTYTRFASEWRDQRLAEGAAAEAAFWNSVVSLCIGERRRRAAEIRRLECLYWTGRDPEKSGSRYSPSALHSPQHRTSVQKPPPQASPSDALLHKRNGGTC